MVLEIISLVSLIFSILANVFNFTSLNNYFILFIWTAIISCIYGVKVDKRSYRLILLLLMAPLLIFRVSRAFYFSIILLIILYFYLKNSLSRGEYSSYVDSLRSSFFILLGILVFSYLGDVLNRFVELTVPFLTIYFISTIILIRNLRHLNLGMDRRVIKRSNRRYLAIITGLSMFVTIEKLRVTIFGFLSRLLASIYEFIIDVVIRILYYPLSFIILALERFSNWLMSRLSPEGVQYEADVTTEAELIENFEYVAKEVPIINISLRIIITIIAIYLIYRLIRKTGARKRYHIDYIEEREFIIKEEKKSSLKSRLRKPKDLRGQIRYYYQKYLFKLNKQNLNLKKSNTSLEINQKAKTKYPLDTIDEIRDIYIKYRYGEEECEKSQVEDIKDLYKKIK